MEQIILDPYQGIQDSQSLSKQPEHFDFIVFPTFHPFTLEAIPSHWPAATIAPTNFCLGKPAKDTT